jgi:hypothetical protein
MKRILVALAIMSGTAIAQPGNTPPMPPPGQPMPPPDQQPYPPGQPMPPPGQPMPPGQQPEQRAPQDPSQPYTDQQRQPDIVDEMIARAQAASPTLEKVARGAFRRARRAVSIGPTVGAWGGVVPAQDDTESAITFGIALETFKVPILPTPETLKQLVIERAKAKVKDQILARFQGQQPDPVTLEGFVREVWEEAVKEVLGLENIRPKTMERPALNVAIEVNRLFTTKAWAPRLRVGIGVWKFTLGASLAGGLGAEGYEKTPVYLGLELVTHFMMSKNPRSSVVDVFARMDFEMRNRDTNSDQFVLGLRYLLDVF